MCRICAERDPEAAEAAFLVRIAELGITLVEGSRYQGTTTPIALVCAQGHPCYSRPGQLRQGHGICGVCANNIKELAAERYWDRVKQWGARPAEGAEYKDSNTPVELICAAGHRCAPHPLTLRRGKWICYVCAGRDSATAEAEFLSRIAELGATLALGAKYINNVTPVAMTCAAGHECSPQPNNVRNGHGICLSCRALFDKVYLLAHPVSRAVKVGVASGAARVRLHRSRGYIQIALWSGLDTRRARQAERTVILAWREAGANPVMAAPKDGRTETAPQEFLELARKTLEELLGTPASLTE